VDDDGWDDVVEDIVESDEEVILLQTIPPTEMSLK